MLLRALAGGLVARAVIGGLLVAAAAGTILLISSRAPRRAESLAVFRGTVRTISETELTVRPRGGDTRTFLRTDRTVVFKDQQAPARWSDLTARSYVTIKFDERDGKRYARRISIGRQHLRGSVEAVSGDRITVATPDGHRITVEVAVDTRYVVGPNAASQQPGSLSEIGPGMHLVASGGWNGDAFDAASVTYWSPRR